MLTILSLYSYQILMERFQLAENVFEQDRIFLLKKNDARAKIRDYIRNSGKKSSSNEVDDNGDDIQMTADDLERCTRVYISNRPNPAATEIKEFANDNYEEFFSASTSKGRKDTIKDVSEYICHSESICPSYAPLKFYCTYSFTEFCETFRYRCV